MFTSSLAVLRQDLEEAEYKYQYEILIHHREILTGRLQPLGLLMAALWWMDASGLPRSWQAKG